MSLVIEINHLSHINKYKNENLIETIILGIKDISLDSKLKLSIDEAKKAIELIHKNNKKVCINCNRVFHENEIHIAKETLNNIGLNNIDYLMFSDFGIYQLFKDEIKMIYYAPTYLTNSKDVEAYQRILKNIVISNQITIDELKNIINNINNTNNYYIDIFGKNAIFYSKRELLTNYFLYKNQKYNPKSTNYNLIEEYRSEKYPIIEDELGFHLYEYGYYYLLEELDENILKHNLIIHTNFLSKEQSEKIINTYLSYLKQDKNVEDLKKSLFETNLPLYKGAYDMKTVLLKSEVK